MTVWPIMVTSLLSVLLSSCVTTVPNVHGCIQLIEGADCTFINTGTRTRLSEEEYAQIYLGRISFSPEDWGRLRVFIDSICARKGRCKNDMEEKLDELSRHYMILQENGFR